jgi:hypothetical protein
MAGRENGMVIEKPIADEATGTQEQIQQEQFIRQARKDFGYKGAKDARNVWEQATTFCASENLDEESRRLFLKSIVEVFLESKAEAREKFTPKSISSHKK